MMEICACVNEQKQTEMKLKVENSQLVTSLAPSSCPKHVFCVLVVLLHLSTSYAKQGLQLLVGRDLNSVLMGLRGKKHLPVNK